MTTDLGKNSQLTGIEIEIIVKKAVRETLETLGIDLSDNRAVRELQADFLYMRDQRVGARRMGEYVKKSVVTTVIGGLLWALWYGIQLAMKVKG